MPFTIAAVHTQIKLSRSSALASDFQKSTTNERPRKWSDLVVNSCLEVMDIASTKLNILGVKLQVNEVKKLDFHVNLKK